MSDRPGEDVPTDPWGNPLPPDQWPKTPPTQGPPTTPSSPGEDKPGWARPDSPTQDPTEPQYPQPQQGQPQYGQPQYGQPQYGQQEWGQDPSQPFGSQWAQPGYGYTPPRTEGMAIGSLVSAIVGICACGMLLGPIAVVLGFVARNRIRDSNGALKGDGLALAGIIVGIAAFVLAIVGAVYYLNNPDIFEFETN